jgi:hypothetical protein
MKLYYAESSIHPENFPRSKIFGKGSAEKASQPSRRILGIACFSVTWKLEKQWKIGSLEFFLLPHHSNACSEAATAAAAHIQSRALVNYRTSEIKLANY